MKCKSKVIKIIVAMLSGLLVTSCAKKTYTPPKPVDPGSDPFTPIDLGPGIDASPSQSELNYHSNQDYNVGTDYKLKVKVRGEASRATRSALEDQILSSTNEIISVLDNSDTPYAVSATEMEDEEGKYYLISPTSGTYKEGAIFIATLKDDLLCFKDKDPSFRQLFFSIPKDETNYFNISENVPFFDINKVVSFPVADGELPHIDDPSSEEAANWFNSQTYHFYYQTAINLTEGQEFGVSILKGGKPDLSNENTFYGRFVSCFKEGLNYKITFKNADLTEIFKDDTTGDTAFEFYQVDENPKLRNVKQLSTADQIKDAIFATPDFQRLAKALEIESRGAVNGVPEILDQFSATLDMKVKDNSYYFTVGVSGLVPVGENKEGAIKVGITLQWVISFQTTGSVKIKKFWGIPYDIEASGEVTKITDFNFQFTVSWMKKFTPEENDKSIADRINDTYKKLEDDPAYFMPRTSDPEVITANHISKPLASLDVPFGYVFSFQIALSLEFTMDLNVMFRYGYHSHTVEKIISFNSDDGIYNTGNTTEASCSTHSLDLGGTLYLEAGIKLSMSIGVVGVRKLFQVGASVYVGVYFSMKAMGGLSFGDDQAVTMYGGLTFEIGLKWSLDGYIDLLFVIHFDYQFAGDKWVWKQLSTGASVLDIFASDQNFDTYEINIDETDLLTCKIFSTDDFTVSLHTYQTMSRVKFNDETLQPLFIESLTPGMSIDQEHNKIIISDTAPAQFSGQLKISINPKLDGITSHASSRVVNVNFRSKTAKTIYFEGQPQDSIVVEPGKTVNFPDFTNTPSYDEEYKFDEITYDSTGSAAFKFKMNQEVYDFISYSDGTNEYEPHDSFIMPDRDIILSVNLYKIVYYYVSFYNGNNELIKTYKVRENTASPEPSEEERYMEGYYFYGWDRDFRYVTCDFSVYGIYVKYDFTPPNELALRRGVSL